ncbi:MAG TPA: hypothetical protein VLA49_01765 [Anaerolineales bacterium]|nr:hypothetical protein [Anaerolineales bacterium]
MLSQSESQGKVGKYRAFLLRCQQDVGTFHGERAPWRFTLVQVGAEDRKLGFACLEDLFAFLQAELEVDR